MKKPISYLLSALILINSAGCARLFGSTKSEPTPKEERQASASNSSLFLEKKASGVEITWEVPSDPVDGFVIRYGQDRTQLTKEVTLLLSELREERDSQYGSVYRYIVPNLESDGPVYVSVAAFKGETISDFSEAVGETARSATR
jgi:hypothetical protein